MCSSLTLQIHVLHDLVNEDLFVAPNFLIRRINKWLSVIIHNFQLVNWYLLGHSASTTLLMSHKFL